MKTIRIESRAGALLCLLVVLLVLAGGMASRDFRTRGESVGKISLTEQSWASAESGALTGTITLVGRCEQVEVDVAENTTNGITFTVALTTADGAALFSQAAIADNGSTLFKATSDATDFDAFLAAEIVTFTITPSGAPGATGATVNVGVYLE